MIFGNEIIDLPVFTTNISKVSELTIINFRVPGKWDSPLLLMQMD
jgi:hypothetical protein